MSEEEKTIWKKSLFSTEHNNEPLHEGMKDGVDNLDIIQIQKKMKKINKRKKYNIDPKNIEIFENIYEKEPIEYFLHGNVDSRVEGMATSGGVGGGEDSGKCCDETPAEGFEADYAEPDIDEQEGFIEGAKGRKGGSKKNKNPFTKVSNVLNSLSMGLYKTVFFFPNKIDKMMTVMSYMFTETFSKGQDQDPSEEELQHDSRIVKRIIYSILCFPICVFITYNWFYLLAYQEEITPGKMERPAKDANRIKINFNSFDSRIRPFVTFWLDYCIFPLSVLDKWILGDNRLPSVFSMFIKAFKFKIIVKFILLLVSFHFIFGVNLFGKLKSSLSGKMNPLSIFCMVLIFICWFKKVFTFMLSMKWLPGFIPTMFWVARLIFYAGFSIMVALFSFQISSIIVLLYFWGHSLFGMSFYGDGSTGEKMSSVDDYVNQDLDMIRNKNEDCIKPGTLKKILFMFGKFLYENFYYFAYFYLMSKNIFNSYTSIYSKSLKYVIGLMLMVQLVLIVLTMWSKSREKNAGNKSVNRFNAGVKPAEQTASPLTPDVDATPTTATVAPASSNVSENMSKQQLPFEIPNFPEPNDELINKYKELITTPEQATKMLSQTRDDFETIKKKFSDSEPLTYNRKSGKEAGDELKKDLTEFQLELIARNRPISKIFTDDGRNISRLYDEINGIQKILSKDSDINLSDAKKFIEKSIERLSDRLQYY
jgi:hypothetical protein